MTFGAQIKAERERIGWTQEQAATAVVVSARAWQYWESGKATPAKRKQDAVAALLAQQRTPGNGKKGKV